MRRFKCLNLTVFAFLLLNCGSEPTKSGLEPFSISFSPAESAVSNTVFRDTLALKLEIKNMKEPVFGMSFSLEYTPVDPQSHQLNIVFWGGDDFRVGNFFGMDPIVFVESNDVFVSLKKGETAVSGSGTLGTFQFVVFNTETQRTHNIGISDLCFYDSKGSELSLVEEPRITGAVIKVNASDSK